MDLAEEIRRSLKTCPLNCAELARRVKVHPVTMRSFKCGIKKLSLPKLLKLADIIGLQIQINKKVGNRNAR